LFQFQINASRLEAFVMLMFISTDVLVVLVAFAGIGETKLMEKALTLISPNIKKRDAKTKDFLFNILHAYSFLFI